MPLWFGLAGALAVCAVLLIPGQTAAATVSGTFRSLAMAVGVVLAVGCGLRLALQLPVIEASEFGIAVWLHGPYRNPFFVPWRRVRAIVLTRAHPAGSPAWRARQALGIELECDGDWRAPDEPGRSEVPLEQAPRAHLAWSHRIIGGDLPQTAALLRRMQSVHGGASAP